MANRTPLEAIWRGQNVDITRTNYTGGGGLFQYLGYTYI